MLVRRSVGAVLRIGLVALVVAGGCERGGGSGTVSAAAAEPLTLEQLEGGDAAKASGERLMALAPGLHRLDTTTPAPTSAVIGVHGYESKGYEWAYPLRATGDGSTRVYFYRYDWAQCPAEVAKGLGEAVERLLEEEVELNSVRILSHSYGGVVATMLASSYAGRVPLTVDVVASPLAGVREMEARCGYGGAVAPAEGVELRQWRTIHALDNALGGIEPDPQVVELPGEVTRLPETYQGHRLGHNWSISWVVDELGGGAKP